MPTSLSNLEDTTGAQHALRPLVLVTDDHEETRFLLRTVLGISGYAVIEAVEGEEAVRLTETVGPDLILMDGSLPRVDGLGATRRIWQLGRTGRVPIVFVSKSISARAHEV